MRFEHELGYPSCGNDTGHTSTTEDNSRNESVPVAGAVTDLNIKTPEYGPQDRHKCQQQSIKMVKLTST